MSDRDSASDRYTVCGATHPVDDRPTGEHVHLSGHQDPTAPGTAEAEARTGLYLLGSGQYPKMRVSDSTS
jgi:hypothetical protein